MSAPIPGFELTVEDGLRVTDWMMWVYPASRTDRQLNRQIYDRCGLSPAGADLTEASASSSEADLAMSVRDLGLPYRAIDGLEHHNIRSLFDLLRRSPDDLATIPGVNRETVRLIVRRLSQWNLELGSVPPPEAEPAEPVAPSPAPPSPARSSARPIALSWEEAETVLRWYTYVPPHFRAERDRRIAAALADYLDVPLSTFDDTLADDYDEEATFDLVDSDDELPGLPGEVLAGNEEEDDEDAEADKQGSREASLPLADEDDQDDEDDEFDDDEDDDDDEEIVFELDEDLARDLGIEGTTEIEPAEPPGSGVEIEPTWTPEDPDAWKSGDDTDPDYWKGPTEEEP